MKKRKIKVGDIFVHEDGSLRIVYKYWKSGTHEGNHEKEFIACDKCQTQKKDLRRMFLDFLNIKTK